jgi:hypothetical protein
LGGKIVDLQAEFRGAEGFSPRRLSYMKVFAGGLARRLNFAAVAAKLPCGYHIVLEEGGRIKVEV